MNVIVTFLTEKIVAVFITVIVVVAAVPSLVVIIGDHTITIVPGTVASGTRLGSGSRGGGDDERTRIIIEVRTAGDDVIAILNGNETSCDSQIDALAGQSKLSASETATKLARGKKSFHAALAPFIKEIRDDEDEFQHLTVITRQEEQVFLARIAEVRFLAVGDGDNPGVLITFCQTVIIEIREVIVIVIVQPAPPGSDEGDD